MKKLLMVFVAMAMGLYAAESLLPGLTWLKNAGDSTFVDINVTTDAAADSQYSKWYLSDQIGEYNSLRVVLDSVRGAFTVAIDLQESWDGVNVEFSTTILSFAFGVSRTDTTVEVNPYPAPYLRYLIRETDAAATESLQVDTLTHFSR
jgi:hypothetical protein